MVCVVPQNRVYAHFVLVNDVSVECPRNYMICVSDVTARLSKLVYMMAKQQ
jgi:hypothetical protein